MPKALVQCRDGAPANPNIFTSYYGFKQMGWEIVWFDDTQIDTIPLDRKTVVLGGAQMVEAALKRLGIDPPMIQNLPF